MCCSEIKKHCRGVTHKKNADAIKQSRSILPFQQSGGGDDVLKSKVTRPKVIHSNVVEQQIIPFLFANHLFAIYWSILPNSKIVINFKRSRTKINAILNKAMNPALTLFRMDFFESAHG